MLSKIEHLICTLTETSIVTHLLKGNESVDDVIIYVPGGSLNRVMSQYKTNKNVQNNLD